MERQEKNIDLSAEEMMNLSSYSTDQQLKVYDTTKLKSVEVPVFEKYFNVGQKKKVLDIGIGGGRTTGYLIDYGHEVTGIDLSDKMVELAQKKYPGSDVRVMNATQLDFPDNNFDIVLFSFNGIDCIYPEEKRFQALMEAHRVLKSGGLFILSSHNSIIIPKTKYDWFWWLVNIITLRIFGAYRLEYKQFHKGDRKSVV